MTTTTILITLTIAFTFAYIAYRLLDVLSAIKTALTAKSEVDKRRQATLERTAELMITKEKEKTSFPVVTEQDIKDLLTASPKYNKGELPERPVKILTGARQSTEGSSYSYITTAITETGTVFLIDWQPSVTPKELQSLENKQYTYNGETFPVEKVIVDAAGRLTQQTYTIARDTNYKIIPSFARTPEQGMMSLSREVTNPSGLGGNLPVTYLHMYDAYYANKANIGCLKKKTIKFSVPQDLLSNDNPLPYMADCLKFVLCLKDRLATVDAVSQDSL